MTIRFAYEYFRYLTPSRNLSLQLSLSPDARCGNLRLRVSFGYGELDAYVYREYGVMRIEDIHKSHPMEAHPEGNKLLRCSQCHKDVRDAKHVDDVLRYACEIVYDAELEQIHPSHHVHDKGRWDDYYGSFLRSECAKCGGGFKMRMTGNTCDPRLLSPCTK